MASKSFAQFGVLGLFTETPLHCGSESSLGYVDLPIQRERHTGYPVIPGSTLKGVLKDESSGLGGAQLAEIFGEGTSRSTNGKPAAEGTPASDGKPGTVSFGDGILVAFPVRSSGAPFHWVTCPFVLQRVLRRLGSPCPRLEVADGKALARSAGDVLLEDFAIEKVRRPELFSSEEECLLATLLKLLPGVDRGFDYVRDLLPDHLLILSDADFRELVEVGTDIVTRIKLNVLGTTTTIPEGDARAEGLSDEDRQGNLFVEELVPPETFFVAPLRAPGRPDGFVRELQGLGVIRIGGDETIGRGVTHLTYVDQPQGG